MEEQVTKVLIVNAIIWVSLMNWLKAAIREGTPGGCLKGSVQLLPVSQ
jgi:hypothetical protein